MTTDFPRIDGSNEQHTDKPSPRIGMPPHAPLPPGPTLQVKHKKSAAQRLREQQKEIFPTSLLNPERLTGTQIQTSTIRLPELIDPHQISTDQTHKTAPVEDQNLRPSDSEFSDVEASDTEHFVEPRFNPDFKPDNTISIDLENDRVPHSEEDAPLNDDIPADENSQLEASTSVEIPKPIEQAQQIPEQIEPPQSPPEETGEQAPDEILDHDETVIDNEFVDFSEQTEQTYHDALHGIKEKTDLSNCLVPLLEAIGWNGHPRHIAEAVPHFIDSLDITSFRNIMANLRFESWPIDISLKKLDPRLLPCLFIPHDGDAILVEKITGNTMVYFDGSTQTYEEAPLSKTDGVAYVFKKLETGINQVLKAKLGWFRAVIERFRGLTYQVLLLTLFLNLLALSTPLFVMAVYDKVISSGSLTTLSYFAIGVTLALVCDMVIRTIRSRILAFVGARLDNIVGNAVFQRILLLPAALTERSTVGSQIARIKDFENVREFFTGQIALTFIELPFAIIFVIVIAILGGPVALVPLVMVVLFIILGVVMMPLIQQSVAKSARGSSKRQELVVETLGDMRAVKSSGSEHTWLERYREFSALSSLNSFYTSLYGSLVQTISSIMMTAAGIATVAFGVFRVLEGAMTIGALVACMMLVWRVLGPIQMSFVSIARLTQVKSSIAQINGLMNMKVEREPDKTVSPLARFKGEVSFSRVSMRYSPDTDPALVGVSFDVEPGEVVCVIGGNGSGKTTLLKVLAGLYFQQAGSVRIDEQDLRQLDLIEVRHAISYVPQIIQFFYGTIAQNLRLTRPTASDEELKWAANEAGMLEEIMELEQGSGNWKRSGFDIRIGDAMAGQMPTSFLQRLNLARGYLKRSPVMLFDEPGNGLDYEGDQVFMKKIDRLRGTTTVFIVTHRPSHLKLADKIIWMESGHMKAFGPAEAVLAQIPKNFI